MRLARVTGTLTATVRDGSLAAQKFMVVDVQDTRGSVLVPAVVAVDACGAGVGDLCVLAEGSAARLTAPFAGKAVDACLVAIVDTVNS